jgi:hypothetical protein
MSTTLTRERRKGTVRTAVCAGCDQPLRAEEQYCPTCGAPRPERITLARLFSEARSKLIDLDFKLIRTLRDLVRRPGAAVRRYVEGNRQRLSNPIWFAFLTVTAYIAVNNYFSQSVGRFFDPLVNARGLWPYLFFVGLVPGVALQRALFRKSGYNFAETYTFALLVCGLWVIAETAYIPLARIDGPWIRIALGLIEAVYFAWATTDFVGQRKPSAWLRGVLVYVGYAGTLMAALYLLFMRMVSKLG